MKYNCPTAVADQMTLAMAPNEGCPPLYVSLNNYSYDFGEYI